VITQNIFYLCSIKIAYLLKQEALIFFGERIRELRKQRGLSQEQLAFDANLHRTYIGMIERAEKNITLLNIEKIAIALGVDINQLFEKNE
jgi:transcriptional regulator with XRE-family HTH domain